MSLKRIVININVLYNECGDFMKDISILFMGTPEFCVPILESLIDNYNVVGVVTQPDKETGRHKELKFSPIKECAIKHGILVMQPEKIRKDYEEILNRKPDLIVTCAYGQIIPKAILDCPKYGCINVHASLLPKYRGGAPMQRAIMNGDEKTGITIMYMDENMDTGNIISMREVPILKTDNLEDVHDKLSACGKELLLDTLPSILSGTNESIKQNDSEATYAPIISREDEKIDFNKTAKEIYNHIRALSPYPGSYATLDGKIVKIYNAYIKEEFYTEKENGEIGKVYKDGLGISCKDFEIVITDVKFEGKKRMLMKDYFNGNDPEQFIGKVFNKD